MSDSNRRHTPSLGVISTIFGCVLLICFANSVSREDSRSFSIKNSFGKGLLEIFEAAPYFIQPCVRYHKAVIVILNFIQSSKLWILRFITILCELFKIGYCDNAVCGNYCESLQIERDSF